MADLGPRTIQNETKRTVKFTPESQAILERAQPEDRLDRLWCELLASEYGGPLLDAWELDLASVRASAPQIDQPRERVLRSAELLGHFTAPMECAEWVAEALLTSRPDWTGPPLEDFTDHQLHEIENDAVYSLAFEEGLEEPQERHYLRAARQVWPAMDRLLEFAPKPLDRYNKKHVSRMLSPGPIEPIQLALACSRIEGVSRWMGRLGVAKWRIFGTITDLDDRWVRSRVTSKQLSWLGPATEEAHLLGAAEVTPDHLLLALLGKTRGLVARTVGDLGVDPKLIRRRLSLKREPAVRVTEMAFTPELLAICQSACQKDGKDPFSETLFAALLDQHSLPEIQADMARRTLETKLFGSLPRDLSRLSLGGLQSGMGEAEVLARWGEPCFRHSTSWLYKRGAVVFKEGKVQVVHGQSLEVDGQPALCKGSHWLEAEKVLGARYLWRGVEDLAYALISRGKVVVLALGRPNP
jgi:hypothetical protein